MKGHKCFLEVVLLGHIFMCDIHLRVERTYRLLDLVWEIPRIIMTRAANKEGYARLAFVLVNKGRPLAKRKVMHQVGHIHHHIGK